MRPAGLAEVEAAKADGRWEAAYEGQRTAEVPADLQRELDASPAAREFFAALDSANRYAIVYRLRGGEEAGDAGAAAAKVRRDAGAGREDPWLSGRDSAPTSPSSAPASPACGPRGPLLTPAARSSCSRPRSGRRPAAQLDPGRRGRGRPWWQWVGSDHVRVQRLAGELGIEIFPQYGAGRNLLDVGGKRRRYRGTIPRLGPRVLWDIFVARRRFDRLARAVGAEPPWAAERAAELDRETLAEWCERNVRTEVARELIGLAGRTVWGTGPEELSMLHVLFYVAAAGSFDKLIDTEGGAQQDRLDGGAQLLPLGLAESLGERVRLGAPVRRISQATPGSASLPTASRSRRNGRSSRSPRRSRPGSSSIRCSRRSPQLAERLRPAR